MANDPQTVQIPGSGLPNPATSTALVVNLRDGVAVTIPPGTSLTVAERAQLVGPPLPALLEEDVAGNLYTRDLVVESIVAAPGGPGNGFAGIVAGLDGSGTVNALPVAADGALAPAVSVKVGGRDEMDNGQPLSVSPEGALTYGSVLNVGGVDASDAARHLGIARETDQYTKNILMVGGRAGTSATLLQFDGSGNLKVTSSGGGGGGLIQGFDGASATQTGSIAQNGTAQGNTTLNVGGIDSGASARPLAVTVAGNPMSGSSGLLIVGGMQSGGTTQALPVGANGGTAGPLGVIVDGIDGSGNAHQLPVSSSGTAGGSNSLTVGGIDGNGNSQQLNAAATGTLGNQVSLGVGGVAQDGTANLLGVAPMGVSVTGSPNSLNVGGLDGGSQPQILAVVPNGSQVAPAETAPRVLIVGGIDAGGNGWSAGVGSLGNPSPLTAELVGASDPSGNLRGLQLDGDSSLFVNPNGVLVAFEQTGAAGAGVAFGAFDCSEYSNALVYFEYLSGIGTVDLQIGFKNGAGVFVPFYDNPTIAAPGKVAGNVGALGELPPGNSYTGVAKLMSLPKLFEISAIGAGTAVLYLYVELRK